MKKKIHWLGQKTKIISAFRSFASGCRCVESCNFGTDPGCIFRCNCRYGASCDSITGECAGPSTCRDTRPPGYGWGGPGCLRGSLLSIVCYMWHAVCNFHNKSEVPCACNFIGTLISCNSEWHLIIRINSTLTLNTISLTLKHEMKYLTHLLHTKVLLTLVQWVWVTSKFNGTSTPKGSYSAKTCVNYPMNLNGVHQKNVMVKWVQSPR